MSNHYDVKQVILMRTDLRNTKGQKVRSGKLMAQASHASMMWLGKRFREAGHEFQFNWGVYHHDVCLSEAERKWLVEGDFAKIVLAVDSEAEMNELVEQARKLDLTAEICVDNGATEFGGVKTPTCAAIGPAYSAMIDEITRHLKTL